MFPYLDAEREWILIHEMNKKLAICSVYMAAEVVGATFLSWNNDLYAMLSSELSFLRDDGYICVLMGDFNGHIGNDSYGITGNHSHINDNGRLVRNFVTDNRLTLVNADQRRCNGLFTRRGHMSFSIGPDIRGQWAWRCYFVLAGGHPRQDTWW